MKIFAKITCFVCIAILTLNISPNIAHASTIEDQNPSGLISPEVAAALNGTYLEYITKQSLQPGDEIISDKTIYIRVNESNPDILPTVVSEYSYINEIPAFSIVTRGYKPGQPIGVPDKWNWITLRLNTIKLQVPIHNNKYSFTGAYNWKKRPLSAAGKDVFGIANDGNIVFDTSTVSGQAINDSPALSFNAIKNFDINSKDLFESVSGVAFKNKVETMPLGTMLPCGYISVHGNNTASSGAIGVTYAHSQISGSFSVSVSSGGPSISVSPKIGFDTITSTAAIDF